MTDASRLSWRFADDGRTIACTVVAPGEPPVLEVTQLAPSGPSRRTLIPVERLGPHSQLLPLSHGRVLICHHRHGGQQIDLVTTEGPTVRRLLTTEQPGLRLIALPDQQGAAIAISNGTDGRSTSPARSASESAGPTTNRSSSRRICTDTGTRCDSSLSTPKSCCSRTKKVSARDCRSTTGAPAERRRSTPLRA
jgi:hypothetical protein